MFTLNWTNLRYWEQFPHLITIHLSIKPKKLGYFNPLSFPTFNASVSHELYLQNIDQIWPLLTTSSALSLIYLLLIVASYFSYFWFPYSLFSTLALTLKKKKKEILLIYVKISNSFVKLSIKFAHCFGLKSVIWSDPYLLLICYHSHAPYYSLLPLVAVLLFLTHNTLIPALIFVITYTSAKSMSISRVTLVRIYREVLSEVGCPAFHSPALFLSPVAFINNMLFIYLLYVLQLEC